MIFKVFPNPNHSVIPGHVWVIGVVWPRCSIPPLETEGMGC